jgi:ribosome-binding factor A
MAYRKEKLEELIKRSVSDFLLTEIKDPRIGFVTVTRVELTKDYSIARVGISVLGNPREIRKSYEGLKSAAGFVQHHLVKAHDKTCAPHRISTGLLRHGGR